MAPIISVIGGLDYDMIMVANRAPNVGESLVANEYLEALGGKGANTAIATYRAFNIKPSDFKPTQALRHDEGTYSQDMFQILNGDNSLHVALNPTEQNSLRQENDPLAGAKVKLIGALGDDDFARRFYEELNKTGIDISGVIKVPGKRTSVCFVVMENYTRRNRCLFTLGATDVWKKEDFLRVEDLGNGERPDMVISQMEIRKDVVEQMIHTAGKAGIDFLLNAAPVDPLTHPSYQYLTHLLVNEAEVAVMSGRETNEVTPDAYPIIAQEFLDKGVKNLVMTLGPKGAYYANATDSGHVPAYRIKVEDTTGAGAAFTGTYACEYMRSKASGKFDIRAAVVRASKASAISIMSFGAQLGMPWKDEIDKFEAELILTDSSSMSVIGAEEVNDDLEGLYIS